MVAMEVSNEKPEAHPFARLPLVLAAVLLAAAGTTYAALWTFSTFQIYDDEGYFLVLVKHLLDGRRMYDDVSTVYGPAYLLYRWVLNGLCALPLDTDGVRLTTLAAWLACAILAGGLVRTATRGQRFAGWCVLAAAGFELVHLSAFANEPGHPQDLAQLFLLGGLAAFAALRSSRARTAAVVLGLAIAGLGLTKVNLGVVLGLPALLALVADERSLSMKALRGSLLAAAVALPWVLMRTHLGEGWALGLGAVASCGTLAAFAFSKGETPSPRRNELAFALVGIALGSLVCVGFALIHGATLAGLYRAIVALPARFTTEIVLGIRVPAEAGIVALVALAAAWFVRWKGERLPAWVVPSAELAFAFFVLLALPSHREMLIPFALPFAWLVLVDEGQRGARLALVLAAPLQALQVFPVSGSQEVMGTSLLVPIAAIALADACAALAPARVLSRPRLALAGALASVPALYVTFVLAERSHKVSGFYASQDELPLPGARWTRFEENIGARARFLADTVSRSCDTFLGVRGDNSLYVWTDRKPLTGVIVSHSWKLFDERQQNELGEALADTPRVLVLDNRSLVDAGLRARLPFFQVLQRSFRASALIGADELCVRREAADPDFSSCVLLPEADLRLPGARLAVRWPAGTETARLEASAIERLQVADLLRGTLFADSASPEARHRPRLWDADELLFDGTPGRNLALKRIARARDLRLEIPGMLPPERASFTRVRFFAASDQRILTLPIVVLVGRR